MSDYTIRTLADVPDAFGGKWPGEMRFLPSRSATSRSRSRTA